MSGGAPASGPPRDVFLYVISGYKALWHRAPNMDTLVALGATAAFVYSTYALFAMTGAQVRGDEQAVMNYMMDFYFESAAMILTLITVGKTLEARAKGKKRDSASGTVYVIEGDMLKPVAIQLGITDNRSTEIVGGELKEGDTLVVSEAPAAATKPSSVGMRLF